MPEEKTSSKRDSSRPKEVIPKKWTEDDSKYISPGGNETFAFKK